MKITIVDSEPPIAPDRGTTRRAFIRGRTLPIGDLLRLQTILVPLDFSDSSMQALKYAIPLAEKFKAAIHLIHVQPDDELTAISRAGQLMLNCADAIALMQDRLAEIQRAHDVQFWPDNCHVPSGRPDHEICRLAATIKADLIVLSTHGYTGLKHVVLGSTAERVVRFAPCPVLVLRGAKYQATSLDDSVMTDFKLGRILVPVDFSKCSLAGVRYAARLARSMGASLHLFHAVYPYAQVIGFDRMSSTSGSLVQIATETAREEMARLKAMTFLQDITCETEVRVGPTADAISNTSGRREIDLLVTSTHGRTGFRRALLGSVAEQVVRYAKCPVITVPSRSRF
ncbi:MAG: universal stress protein [Chthoniobacterales bacterium]